MPLPYFSSEILVRSTTNLSLGKEEWIVWTFGRPVSDDHIALDYLWKRRGSTTCPFCTRSFKIDQWAHSFLTTHYTLTLRTLQRTFVNVGMSFPNHVGIRFPRPVQVSNLLRPDVRHCQRRRNFVHFRRSKSVHLLTLKDVLEGRSNGNRSGIPVSRSWYEGFSLECSPDGRDYRPSILPHR